jgi:hypothetical protein
MTDQERFESIVAQLSGDRRWLRRLLWLRTIMRLASVGTQALASMALAMAFWLPCATTLFSVNERCDLKMRDLLRFPPATG